MRKSITVLTICSIVVAAVALLLGIIFVTVFWEPACRRYAAGEEVMAAGPIIPAGSMVYMVACLGITVAVCIFSKSSKTIVFEIIAIVLICAVLPVLVWCLPWVEALVVGHFMGEVQLAALSVASAIITFATRLMDVSGGLCLVVCGMSISDKVHSKKSTYCEV